MRPHRTTGVTAGCRDERESRPRSHEGDASDLPGRSIQRFSLGLLDLKRSVMVTDMSKQAQSLQIQN